MKYILIAFSLLVTISVNAQQYKTHQVQEDETIISIAKLYKVTPLEIYQLNPDAKQGLRPNAILIIPKTKVPSSNSETIVTITKELDGFKKHKARRKETLYSISKKYNVEIEDIKKHNKWLYAENLRKGDKLQIPIFREVKKTEIVDNSIQSYTVQQGEGKWRVAYKFGISVEELEALNPDLGKSLTQGQILTVPNIADNMVKTVDDTSGYYKVLAKEGFYRLKVKLGLTQEQLETLNPELKTTGLKDGMILKIPKSTTVLAASTSMGKFSLRDSINNYDTKHLVVMLPFELNRIDPDSVYEAKRRLKSRSGRVANVSLDFHSGVLMAIDSAKYLGISTKLDVYDTRNQLSQVSNIINSNNFSGVDAVIGPLLKNNFERAASGLKRDNIPLVCPIIEEVQLYDNVFQTRPSDDMLRNKIINYVAQDSTVKKVVVISDSKNKATSKLIKNKFSSAKEISSRERENKKGEKRDGFFVLPEDFEELFKPGKNVVFLETENNGFVSNVTSTLNTLISPEEKIEIVLMTTKMNTAFEGENVSNVHLSNLKFHFPSVQKDYSEESKNAFVQKYKKKYGIAPNKFAVRGFDLTMDVLLRLSSSENLYQAADYNMETEYVENKFNYKKKLFGGYYNEAAYIVKYHNLSLIEAK